MDYLFSIYVNVGDAVFENFCWLARKRRLIQRNLSNVNKLKSIRYMYMSFCPLDLKMTFDAIFVAGNGSYDRFVKHVEKM